MTDAEKNLIIRLEQLDAFGKRLVTGIKVDGNVWIGLGANASSVAKAANLQDSYRIGDAVSLTATDQNIVAVMPTEVNAVLVMSGIEVPATVSTTTISGTQYRVVKSASTYTGTFTVSIE